MRRILKISDLQVFYLAMAAIFIFTGFIYNFFFFRLFNIKVEHFFTLQDYLASSIEKVYLIIIALLFATISSYLARYIMREKQKFQHHGLVIAALYCIPVIIFILGVLMLIQHKPSGYFLLSFAIYASGDFILFKIIFKGNHDSYSRYFYFTVFIFYALLILSTVVHDRDSIRHKSIQSMKNYQIYFTRDVNINPDNCIILEANENFFFLYDKSLNKAYAVPKEGISYIETTR